MDPKLQPGLRKEFYWCIIISAVVVWSALCLAKGSLFLAIAFGAVLALTSGTVFVVPIQYVMRSRAGVKWHPGEPKTSSILGYVERALVFGACVLQNGPIIIAAWIAFKSVSQWKGWEEPTDAEGRAKFNMFLVGTACSVMAAVACALFSLWLYRPDSFLKALTFGVPSDLS